MFQLVLAFVSRLRPGCILVATAFAFACELGAAQFTLRWADNSSNESGFQIERATGSAGAFSLVATTAANVTSYVDTGLADATLYRYRVRAFNSAGFSPYSNIASGTTPAASAPAPNTAPTITAIANRTVVSGVSSGTIAFTVGDAQTAAGSLMVTATSSNTTILPSSRLALGGSGAARTLTFTPLSGTSGTSTVTLRVSDGSLSASTSFVVTVTTAAAAQTNTAPTITTIAPQTIAANGSSSTLSFSIGDAQTSANNLALSVTSSNTGLVPLSGITLGGSGANRTVTIRPAANATGSSTITIIVSDGSLTASTAFVTTVVSSAFMSGDVGSPAISGSTTTSGTTTQIRAGGTDIWNTSDQFHFSRQSLTGDAELKVRLTGLTASDPWAKAGLMFRASTQANAAYAFVFLTPNNGVALQSRSATGGRSGQQSAAPATIPNWLRLTRSGNTFHAAYSTDGNTWRHLGSVVVDLPTTALAGLAVTSHAATVATTATFQNLTTTLPSAAPSPAPSQPAPPPVNTAPTITSIAGRTIAMNATSPAIAFTIGDAQTAASGLTLSAESSNPALVPVGNITFGGSGANRTLTIRPVANATGSSTITVTVSDGSLTTSTSFAVTVAASLISGDIGSPAIAGSLSVNGATMQVRAGGADIWGSHDQFHFARQSLAGDRELTVRVAGLTNTDAWAKAGLMFRSSTAANAAFVHLFITPSNGVVLQYRTANGANASQRYRESATVPRWLKLTRVGNTFYAFHSANGTTWTLLDFVTVNLPDTALAGLAVTSHNVSAATTATFENLKID